ncbi:MAG: PAS domain S-box protein [Chlorobiaceae bacterium]|nr:PAS domain S-box protein [Chlorobiaceae bacterium]
MLEEYSSSTPSRPHPGDHPGPDSEARSTRLFLENLPGMLCMLYADGRFARWNPCIRDILVGKPDEEMPSVNATEIIHPDDLRRVVSRMRNVLETGVEETVEFRMLKKGGPDFRWFLVTGARIMIRGELFLYATGIDTTDRKQAGDALWKSEQRFRAITEQIDAPVFISDSSGIMVYMSQAMRKLSGYTREDLLGKPFGQLLDREDIPVAMDMLGDVLADSRKTPISEFRLRKKDGSIRYAEISLQSYHDSTLDGVIGLIYDLTQRKQYEALATFRIRLLQMVGTATPEELMQTAIDEAERMTDSSFGFFHFLETSGNDYPQRVWSGQVRKHMASMDGKGSPHPMDETPFWREAVHRQAPVICNDYSLARTAGLPAGHMPILRNTLVVPVSAAEGIPAVFLLGNKRTDYDEDDANRVSALVGLVWDIVERQRAEQSEGRLQVLLMQIQKMEVVSKLAGGIAHDFNNQLGVILGNAEMALTEQDLDPEVKHCLEEISKAAERSAELTSQLLAFARKQTALPKLLDLNTVVEETLGMLRGLIGTKVVIFLNRATEVCPVRVDPEQVSQILTNLCMNACDAIDGDGRITISIRRVHIDAHGNPGANSGMSGDFVELSVADTGHGIGQEHRAHIFEPFYTTKAFGKGTGLGLATVYGIIKQNRGFIDFDTGSGKGSVFRVCLPLILDVDGEAVRICCKEDTEHRKMTILVVEDEPEILNLCRLMLEKTGYRVLPASTPTDAIRLAEEWVDRLDLLITDIVMPEMNGNQLAERIAGIIPGLRTLFMSGYTADIIACHGILDTGVNFIHKPFTVMALSRKVNEILAS